MGGWRKKHVVFFFSLVTVDVDEWWSKPNINKELLNRGFKLPLLTM